MIPAFLRTSVATLILLATSSATYASADAFNLLDKMSHSFRELNYQGVFSYQQGDDLQSLRITHSVINGEEYERLEYMDGDQRDVVRHRHDLNCVHPGHRIVRMLSTSEFDEQSDKDPIQGEALPSKLSNYYQFSNVGTGRIAGRDVTKLLISPKDSHRLTRRLALDDETGLLLQSVLIGPKNKVLERFQFVDITIGKKLAEAYFHEGENSHEAPHIGPATEAPEFLTIASRSWSVKWIPGGYTPVIENSDNGSEDIATFTDGLAVFSVFLERSKKNSLSVEGQSQRGATIAYSKPVLLAGRPHRVTVVGEIPSQTAQLVAESITLVPSQ
ncbi:MAG: sigma-E factor negative regulatory protein RseB [Oceanicoccus sp.]|jgi:sigma-E factor negative regulatory protein RseB